MAKTEALLLYLYRKVGFRDALRAAEFLTAWGVYVDSESPEKPSVEGYAKYWKESIATAYRGLAAFRRAFPDDRYPDRVWGLVRRQVEFRNVAQASKDVMFAVGAWV